jgi:CRISPR/Cas system CSM-associated protein Csm3 (group 7 of RAMP superfamily)
MKNQRIDIDYCITWETAWHAGSGQASAAVDRLVRRRAHEKPAQRLPILPGSQLKGVLRHQCERLACLLECEVIPPHQVRESDELVDNFRPLRQSTLLVDRLFGTRYQGECLFVDDAKPAGTPSVQTQGRTAIDRLTRTAKERTLFFSEVTDGGEKLEGRIRGRHPAGVLTQYDGGFPYEYALLIAALLSIESLGATRSAGRGKCHISVKDDEVLWNEEKKGLGILADCFEIDGWNAWVQDLREGAGE